MLGDQIPEDANRETLLFTIKDRLERAEHPLLRASEAAELLTWAMRCTDPREKEELLLVFERLGGLEMVRAALSDFD